MQRFIPYLLLLVGISMAAAFGARNGDTHNRYRAASWYAQTLQSTPEELGQRGIAVGDEGLDAARVTAEAEQGAIGLPAPSKRLSEWWRSGGFGWLVGVILIVLGAGLARRQAAVESMGEPSESGVSAVDFLANVRTTLERLDALSVSIAELGMDVDAPEAREEIDRIFAELLLPVVEARGRYVARHGLAVFAEYFGLFAAGERNLARCWSALTDGHAEVARGALTQSKDSFSGAESAWLKADSGLA